MPLPAACAPHRQGGMALTRARTAPVSLPAPAAAPRPERIAEWSEEQLLGGWELSPEHTVALDALGDGPGEGKYCWDSSGIA